MGVATVVKTIGSTGKFATITSWESGAPADLTTSERSAAGTFLVTAFTQGETLSFVGSGAAGKFLDSDSTGAGNGTYVTYGITSGNPASGDVVTGGTSGATCVLSSSTPIDLGIIWQGQCQNEAFSGSGITLGGSTASATCYKELTCVPGASFYDNANKLTNALRFNTANGASFTNTASNSNAISISETGCRVTGMQILCSNSGGRALSITAASCIIDRCILEGTYTANAANLGIVGTTVTALIKNCLIVQHGNAANQIIGVSGNAPTYYNCTIVASDDLATAPVKIFNVGSGSPTAQNCALFAGDSSKAIGTGITFTTCYSDISGTTGVTQATYSSQFQDINDATLDLRIKAGAAIIDTGTTDATNAPTDIVGTSRPQSVAYDVGCWEYIFPVSSLTSRSLLISQAVNRASTY